MVCQKYFIKLIITFKSKSFFCSKTIFSTESN
nr:MAG TPA: hypothetical protein [Bacteriophage sp.]